MQRRTHGAGPTRPPDPAAGRSRRAAVLAALLIAAAANAGAASFASLMNRGVKAYRKGKHAEAAELFRQAEAKDPSRVEAPHSLGRACFDLGEYRQALAAFTRAAAVQENAGDLGGIAMSHVMLHQWARGLPFARRAAALAPADGNVLDILGICALHSGEVELAGSAFAAARGIAVNGVNTTGLAETAYARRDYVQARRLVDEGLAASYASNQREWLESLRGWIELAEGRPDAARRAFGGAIRLGVLLDPNPEGLAVRRVMAASPAERAGVREGDVLAAVGGASARSLTAGTVDALVAGLAERAAVRLDLLRGGARVQCEAVLTFAPDARAAAVAQPAAPVPATPGVVFLDDEPPAVARPAGVPAGPDVAGDAAPREPRLLVLGVRVDPAVVAPGAGFRVVVEAEVSDPAAGATVPVSMELAVAQGGAVLARGAATRADVPNGASSVIVRLVPRAAPTPGTYEVVVTLRTRLKEGTGKASFKVEGR